jgi:hypothetical protein
VSQRMEEELMEDLYEEAEGQAGALEEEEMEEYEGEELEEVGGEGEEWDALEEEEEEFGEEFEEEELGEEYGEEEAFEADEEGLEDAMAYALGAEDTDEFFRRALGALRRVAGGAMRIARRVAPVVGRIARVAAPIARLIPHPWARAAAPILGLLGRLRAEGASEEEAMDAFAELAAYDESAIPVVAGLAARSLLGRRVAAMPMAARRRLVRSLAVTARGLARRRGPVAVRALPRIVRSVRRTAVVRRTPVRVTPRIVRRTAARVARSPRLIRRLARPVPIARRRARIVLGRAAARARTYTLRGPVRISIVGA